MSRSTTFEADLKINQGRYWIHLHPTSWTVWKTYNQLKQQKIISVFQYYHIFPGSLNKNICDKMMDFLCKWWDFSHKKTAPQGFNKLRRCCCRWSGLDTYDFSDFRLKSEGMWGVYSYNIPIGDCILYTMVYRVINGWFILIKSLYLFTWNVCIHQENGNDTKAACFFL